MASCCIQAEGARAGGSDDQVLASSVIRCDFCGIVLPSRNALFRHLRDDNAAVTGVSKADSCSARARAMPGGGLEIRRPIEKVVLWYGYIGTAYKGNVRAGIDDDRTVEWQMWQAIDKARGVAKGSRGYNAAYQDRNHVAGFSRCSRTDAGVHAVANLICFNTEELCPHSDSPEAFVCRVNAALPPDVRVFHRVRVDTDFHARRFGEQRTYKYVMPASLLRAENGVDEELRGCMQLFVGRHSWHNFTEDGARPNSKLHGAVDSLSCEVLCAVAAASAGGSSAAAEAAPTASASGANVVPPVAVLSICATRFVYHQIRRIVGMLIALRSGIPAKYLDAAFNPAIVSLPVPLAPAFALYLRQCRYTAYIRKHGLGARLQQAPPPHHQRVASSPVVAVKQRNDHEENDEATWERNVFDHCASFVSDTSEYPPPSAPADPLPSMEAAKLSAKSKNWHSFTRALRDAWLPRMEEALAVLDGAGTVAEAVGALVLEEAGGASSSSDEAADTSVSAGTTGVGIVAEESISRDGTVFDLSSSAAMTTSTNAADAGTFVDAGTSAPASVTSTTSSRARARGGRKRGGDENGYASGTCKFNELHAAMERRDWALCKSLIHTQPTLLVGKNKNGYTPLMLLAMADWATPAPREAVASTRSVQAGDKTAYWAAWDARKRNYKARLHGELLDIMLEHGAADTAAERTNFRTAADYAAASNKPELANRLRALERPDMDACCPLCLERVTRRNQAVRVGELVASGEESNHLVRRFFCDCEWAEARGKLAGPLFHAVTHNHFPFRKELSETLSVICRLEPIFGKSPLDEPALAQENKTIKPSVATTTLAEDEDKWRGNIGEAEMDVPPDDGKGLAHQSASAVMRTTQECNYPSSGSSGGVLDGHFPSIAGISASSQVPPPHSPLECRVGRVCVGTSPCHLVDLCSGRSLTTAVAAFRFPNCIITAVDLMPPEMLPHYDEAGLGTRVTYLRQDILAPEFTERLEARVLHVGLPCVLMGIHCCGLLSLAAVEAFQRIELVKYAFLVPCCLPPKKDRRTPSSLYVSGKQEPAEQYARWAALLRDGLGPSATLEFEADMLSAKRAVVIGKKALSSPL